MLGKQETLRSPTTGHPPNPLFWLALSVLLSFAILAYPLYVIRPFRYQDPRELAVALGLIRWRPFLEIAFAIGAAFLWIASWRRTGSVWRRILASSFALFVVSFSVLSRVNVYELMFHPLERPTFSPASAAKLDGREEVIAIRLRSVARAYPVRGMSYHHIVNDVAGGVPVVATY